MLLKLSLLTLKNTPFRMRNSYQKQVELLVPRNTSVSLIKDTIKLIYNMDNEAHSHYIIRTTP